MSTTHSPVIYCERLSDHLRAKHTASLFGIHFPMRLEPTIFGLAGQLSPDYDGGYWHFHALSNGGFYMAPARESTLIVKARNGFEGAMSADAFGIMVCLYGYSVLAFQGGAAADTYAEHFHRLRALANDHGEARSISAAID